jgi:hypothetical protein
MARIRKQAWKAGDYFSIPLEDQSRGIGQVISRESGAITNPAICAIFRQRLDSEPRLPLPDLSEDDVIAALFVTPDLLDRGVWRVFAEGQPLDARTYFPDIEARRNREGGFVGVDIVGAGIVRELVNAYFGLSPWDDFHEPDFLDKLLVSADRKPASVRLKSDFPVKGG